MKIAGVAVLAAFVLALASQTACQSSKGQTQRPPPTGHQVQPPERPAAKNPAPSAPRRNQPRTATATVPAGSSLRVRLDHTIGTDSNRPGERFTGSLAGPVTVDGQILIPAGARVQGIVQNAAPSGRLRGRAVLSLTLRRIEWGGQSYPLETTSYSRTSPRHKKRNWALIGGGSGTGALIGGLAGGGIGALIGSGAGVAAGTAGAALTGKRQVRIPAESLLSFKTRQPLAIHGKEIFPKPEKEML